MSEEEIFHQKFNEIVNVWLKEFGLKNLEDDYIPNIPREVKDYIGNKDMKITQGNLMKLIQKEREHFIPFIKSTVEKPNIVLDDGEGILFIKEFMDKDKNYYFMSISKNYDGEWVFSSHTKREINNIRNKIKNSKTIYTGFERSEVAGACDILKSGGEVSKPSHLQIKYTANQDFGTNPNKSITQNLNQNQSFDGNDSSAMEMFRQESAEITKQEARKQEQKRQLENKDNIIMQFLKGKK